MVGFSLKEKKSKREITVKLDYFTKSGIFNVRQNKKHFIIFLTIITSPLLLKNLMNSPVHVK